MVGGLAVVVASTVVAVSTVVVGAVPPVLGRLHPLGFLRVAVVTMPPQEEALVIFLGAVATMPSVCVARAAMVLVVVVAVPTVLHVRARRGASGRAGPCHVLREPAYWIPFRVVSAATHFARVRVSRLIVSKPTEWVESPNESLRELHAQYVSHSSFLVPECYDTSMGENLFASPT